MGRRERHTRDRILGAALRAVASRGAGAVNVAAVRDELGAPVGSIYHRYGSLRHLLAEAWLAAVESFQGGFLAALGGPRAVASASPFKSTRLGTAKASLMGISITVAFLRATIWPKTPLAAVRTAAAPKRVASQRSKAVGEPPRWRCPSTVTRASKPC